MAPVGPILEYGKFNQPIPPWSSSKFPPFITDWEEIGNGADGTVYRVTLLPSCHNLPNNARNDQFAMKEFKKHEKASSSNESTATQSSSHEGEPAHDIAFKKEVEIANITRPLSVTSLNRCLSGFTYKGGNYIISDLAQRNLMQIFTKYSLAPLPFAQKHQEFYVPLLKLINGLASTLAQIHTSPAATVVNFDIAPHNILVFLGPGNRIAALRFTDWARAEVYYDAPYLAQVVERPGQVANPVFVPPEVDEEGWVEPKVLQKYDVWALGGVFLELVVWFVGGREAHWWFLAQRGEEWMGCKGEWVPRFFREEGGGGDGKEVDDKKEEGKRADCEEEGGEEQDGREGGGKEEDGQERDGKRRDLMNCVKDEMRRLEVYSELKGLIEVIRKMLDPDETSRCTSKDAALALTILLEAEEKKWRNPPLVL